MKRTISLILTVFMLIQLVLPINIKAKDSVVKLDVTKDENGFTVEIPDYFLKEGSNAKINSFKAKNYFNIRTLSTKKPKVNPTDNPDQFEDQWVTVDLPKILIQHFGIEKVILTVEAHRNVEYKETYTILMDENATEDPANKTYVNGKDFEIPLPIRANGAVMIIYFPEPDGRAVNLAVEAYVTPRGFALNGGFRGHTGVRIEWFGSEDRPSDLTANYRAVAPKGYDFSVPTTDKNYVLRQGKVWKWWDAKEKKHIPVDEYLELVPENDISINDEGTAEVFNVTINKKNEGMAGTSKFAYKILGDAYEGFKLTLREKVSVDFEAGKGTWKAPATKPEKQFTGHSLTVNDTFTTDPKLGPITVPNGATDLTPPEAESDKPENEFKGWSDTENGAVVDLDTYKITKDTTFYAIFGPKSQGKVKIKYVDANDAEITDVKYHIDGQEYPAEKSGNKDAEVASTLLETSAAPKFLGYEVTEVKVDGKTNANEKVTYTEDGKYTITYKYKKLADIIPEDEASQDVKETYKKVTIKVDENKGKFQKKNADVTGSEFLYYVNPVEGKSLQDVLTESGLTPKSNDENANKIDTNKPWIFTPDKTKADTPADVALTTEVNKDNFKGVDNVVMAVNFGQTKADQLKDKLDPVTIKVWVDETDTDGSKITWKNGVKLNDANKDNETLKGLLAGATVTDLGENGTIAQPGTARNSSKQNLPDGKKGNLKVAFDDDSALVVENQMLYVSPLKVPVKPGEENQIDPEKLPDDKLAVEFKLGEGVKIGDKEGNATTPVLYETYYVKPGSDVKENVPTVTLKEGYKDAKWYKGDAEATDDDYKVTAKTTVFTAKATGKDKVVKLDNPDNPTNFPKDPTDNSKKDADYVTVKFVADANGKIKEGDAEKAKGIAYAVLKNTEWADAVTAGVVVPTENASGNNPKLVGKDKFYSFKEWQKDGTKVTTFPKVEATDLTFTAVFGKADELSVTYNLNAPEGLTVGGTAPTDDTKYVKDEKVTVKAIGDDNKLAGYKFNGWNTQADGKGTAYAADSKFAIKANTELFAQWKKTAKDVIPVDNENDKKGKDGEEIPTNYVFVEFKVKDTDADKAEIKADQQSKFKVDPKVAVTLTAPALELKDGYKDSHIASFNKADYTNKKFEQATTIWASVIEKLVVPTDPSNPNTGKDQVLVKFLKGEHGTLTGIVLDEHGNEVTVKDRDVLAYNVKKTATWAAMKDYIPTAVADSGWRVANPSWKPVLPATDKVVEEATFTAQYVAKPIDEYITLTLDENYRNGKITDYEVLEGDLIENYLYIPHRRGYVFEGWSYDSRRLDEVKPGDRIYYPTTLYAIWTKQKAKDDEEVEPIDTRAVNEHKAYMFGYTDGSVRPNGSITRAEAAALVTRLLGIEANASSMKPAFTDTPSSWYNKAINAAVARGIMKGYPDGRFRPNAPITRAEFTQMIYTFDNKPYGVAPFVDVVGHWAERAIGSEYQAKRITGYPDGLFRPDANITRAEAVVILNKIFERNYDAMSAINAMNKEKIKVFTDLHTSFWGFNDMVEATNTHLFKRRVEGRVEEDWTLVK